MHTIEHDKTQTRKNKDGCAATSTSLRQGSTLLVRRSLPPVNRTEFLTVLWSINPTSSLGSVYIQTRLEKSPVGTGVQFHLNRRFPAGKYLLTTQAPF